MTLNPYLNYAGNCREAFNYYVEHLGAKIIYSLTHREMGEHSHSPGPESADLILHARIQIGDLVVMASDMPPNVPWEPMRSAYLNLGVSSDDEAERFHAALSDGGQIFMSMQETFYAFKFSMLRDKFGINWMVIYERPMPS